MTQSADLRQVPRYFAALNEKKTGLKNGQIKHQEDILSEKKASVGIQACLTPTLFNLHTSPAESGFS